MDARTRAVLRSMTWRELVAAAAWAVVYAVAEARGFVHGLHSAGSGKR